MCGGWSSGEAGRLGYRGRAAVNRMISPTLMLQKRRPRIVKLHRLAKDLRTAPGTAPLFGSRRHRAIYCCILLLYAMLIPRDARWRRRRRNRRAGCKRAWHSCGGEIDQPATLPLAARQTVRPSSSLADPRAAGSLASFCDGGSGGWDGAASRSPGVPPSSRPRHASADPSFQPSGQAASWWSRESPQEPS